MNKVVNYYLLIITSMTAPAISMDSPRIINVTMFPDRTAWGLCLPPSLVHSKNLMMRGDESRKTIRVVVREI